MDKIKTLIVDDEPLAREKIKNYLEFQEEEFEIVASCKNGSEAINAINEYKPDLIFLDIQMPEINGFDVLDNLEPPLPIIVFVTAYDEYALKAFEVHAVDYLLKPFDRKRFEKSLEQVKRNLRVKNSEDLDRRFNQLLQAVQNQERYLRRIMVKNSGRVYFVDVDDIEWISASGNYVEIHSGGKTHLIRETMQNMDNNLDPAQFFRIHRSVIVNIDFVKELQT